MSDETSAREKRISAVQIVLDVCARRTWRRIPRRRDLASLTRLKQPPALPCMPTTSVSQSVRPWPASLAARPPPRGVPGRGSPHRYTGCNLIDVGL